MPTRYDIRIISPEIAFTLQANNGAEKAEWAWILNRTISSWLSSLRSEPEGSTSNKRESLVPKTPVIRMAVHHFYKAGPLQGAVYKGKWRRGLMNGDGVLTWPDGKVYEGHFKDGGITGCVLQSLPN